ncbi:hypothetical protein AXX00_00020 [Pseudomonas aeruginosa]|nr:hypothetical protein A6R75_09815 [Pseudomonas aeruginosa]ARH14602.1 hypothetical protein HW01_31540 [Pseudomonas aeruginosa]KSJ79907.1 hypothetical protein APA02_20895 [Pseudomonas aeruginosa]OES54861.1 hypothetical protein A7R78_30420 [Pseudomonas aeruginosa]ONM65389.1 hypothetical protein B0B25_31360 [Pseudomonas aeruginosa]
MQVMIEVDVIFRVFKPQAHLHRTRYVQLKFILRKIIIVLVEDLVMNLGGDDRFFGYWSSIRRLG